MKVTKTALVAFLSITITGLAANTARAESCTAFIQDYVNWSTKKPNGAGTYNTESGLVTPFILKPA